MLLPSCAVGPAPRRREVLGLILVKELIMWDHSTRTEVGRLKMRSMPLLRADTRLYDMLRLFETCRCHMALLVRCPPVSSWSRECLAWRRWLGGAFGVVGGMHAWNCAEMSPVRVDMRLCDMLRLGETCRCHMALLVRSALSPPLGMWACLLDCQSS